MRYSCTVSNTLAVIIAAYAITHPHAWTSIRQEFNQFKTIPSVRSGIALLSHCSCLGGGVNPVGNRHISPSKRTRYVGRYGRILTTSMPRALAATFTLYELGILKRTARRQSKAQHQLSSVSKTHQCYCNQDHEAGYI